MSRLTNISNIRIPHFNSWKTIWYEKDKNYSFLFFRDFQLYQYLKGLFYRLKMMTDDFYFENLTNDYFFVKVNIYLYRFQVKKYFLSFFTNQYLTYYLLLRYFRHLCTIKSNFNLLYYFASLCLLTQKNNLLFHLFNQFYFSYYMKNMAYLSHTSARSFILGNLYDVINKKRFFKFNKKLKANNRVVFFNSLNKMDRLNSIKLTTDNKKALSRFLKFKLKSNLLHFYNVYNVFNFVRANKKKKSNKLSLKGTIRFSFNRTNKYYFNKKKKRVKSSYFYIYRKQMNILELLKNNKNSKIKSRNIYITKNSFKRNFLIKLNNVRTGIKKRKLSFLENNKTISYFFIRNCLFYFFFYNLIYFFNFINNINFYFFYRLFLLFKYKLNLFRSTVNHFFSMSKNNSKRELSIYYYLKTNYKREISRAVYDERIYYDFFFYFFLYNLILNVEKTIYLFSGNKILFLPSFYFFKKTPCFLSAKLINDFVLTELEKGYKIYGIFKSLQHFQFVEKLRLKSDLRVAFTDYLSGLISSNLGVASRMSSCAIKNSFSYINSLEKKLPKKIKKLEAIIKRMVNKKNFIFSRVDVVRFNQILNRILLKLNKKIRVRNNLYKNWRFSKYLNLLKYNKSNLFSSIVDIRNLFHELYYNEVLAKKYPLIGLRIECNGPTKRGKQARLVAYHQVIKNYKLFGRMPNTTVLADIDYYQSFARTKQGSIGIKVWVFFYSKTYDSSRKLISII